MSDRRRGPVLFDIDEAERPAAGPAEAPPVPDLGPEEPPQGAAMQAAATIAARRPSRLARWFWRLAVAIVVTVASIMAWNFVTRLVTENAWLGLAVGVLFGLFALVALAIVVKELAAFARLARLDDLHRDAAAARASGSVEAARSVTTRLVKLYSGREETRWGRDRLAERSEEVFDGEALLALAETELLAPLDAAARREVQAAARQVAAVTAFVPLAFADVLSALAANLRMIRRIAEIYGGRSGTLGSWRLTRAVFSHLVATGAVAVGDDLIEPILGGGMLARVSRRFGEGVVNGALTARVGVAAMEVCRPVPFTAETRPSVRGLVAQSLTGLFGRAGA
ncbi:YcjF family protein [Roseivivax isoporae]|uniref:GTP-binding protein n=1 Tax=Roseivivax isoporae LMG 25204 TaxID=1449351 RepID=X7F793_9RHOB|nr:TIGR01620 family protein [Roseivivax isoporae]ETX27966.1 hypothetical protein RISW2_10140 [Roseivivax isoporae LMG 25204]